MEFAPALESAPALQTSALLPLLQETQALEEELDDLLATLKRVCAMPDAPPLKRIKRAPTVLESPPVNPGIAGRSVFAQGSTGACLSARAEEELRRAINRHGREVYCCGRPATPFPHQQIPSGGPALRHAALAVVCYVLHHGLGLSVKHTLRLVADHDDGTLRSAAALLDFVCTQDVRAAISDCRVCPLYLAEALEHHWTSEDGSDELVGAAVDMANLLQSVKLVHHWCIEHDGVEAPWLMHPRLRIVRRHLFCPCP